SRRRHTRSKRDWSSDVCSSDLNDDVHCAVLTATGEKAFCVGLDRDTMGTGPAPTPKRPAWYTTPWWYNDPGSALGPKANHLWKRSEERRVGKEYRERDWRCWRS